MSYLWAIGVNRTLYEIRGTRLFIDDEEAVPVSGEWGSVDDAKNAADSYEIAASNGLRMLRDSDWRTRK